MGETETPKLQIEKYGQTGPFSYNWIWDWLLTDNPPNIHYSTLIFQCFEEKGVVVGDFVALTQKDCHLQPRANQVIVV